MTLAVVIPVAGWASERAAAATAIFCAGAGLYGGLLLMPPHLQVTEANQR